MREFKRSDFIKRESNLQYWLYPGGVRWNFNFFRLPILYRYKLFQYSKTCITTTRLVMISSVVSNLNIHCQTTNVVGAWRGTMPGIPTRSSHVAPWKRWLSTSFGSQGDTFVERVVLVGGRGHLSQTWGSRPNYPFESHNWHKDNNSHPPSLIILTSVSPGISQ